MTDAEYHAHPAYSASKIKDAKPDNPMLNFWAKWIDPNRTPFQPTEAMRQGSLVDCLITEPHTFEERYILLPDDAPKRPTAKQLVDGRDSRPGTKANDAWKDAVDRESWWQEVDAKAAGKESISPAWFTTACAIIERLHADPDIGPILKMPRSSQNPHFWTDEQGRECRYKPDLEPEDGSLWDLKKARSAQPRKFKWQCLELAYDIQIGAHYRLGFTDRHGKPPTRSGFIAYEWEYPHNCALLPCTPAFIDYGMKRRNDALLRIEECMMTGIWPSYGVNELDAPGATEQPSQDIELF